MRRMSVRMRLTFLNVAVLGLVLAAWSLAVHATVKINLAKSIDRDLAQSITPRPGEGPPPGPPPGRPGPGGFGDFRPGADRSGADRGERGFAGFGPHGPGPVPGERPTGDRGGPGDSGRAGMTNAPRQGGPPPGDRNDWWRRFRFGPPARGRRWALAPRLLDPTGHGFGPMHDTVVPWDRVGFTHALHGETLYTTVKGDGGPMRILSAPLRPRGEIAGVVQAARPLGEMNALIRGLDRTLLMLIPLAMLGAGFGGAFLTDRALRPVRNVSQAAAQLGAEDLSKRLPVTGHDEFSELAGNFNRMIGRLEEAFRDLEGAYERQRRFAADASHELRTPLTSIKANTSLALVGQRTPEEYRVALEAADRAADTMGRIVRDLLLLARSDAGQLELDLAPVSVLELFDRAISDAARAPDSAAIRIDLPDPMLSVLGDAHRLVRVFVNLIENALRHTPPEGEVVLRGDERGGEAFLSVADTGVGIAPEHLPHLCDRFYRVDAARSRSHGGSGLGLAICRSLIDAHGGTMTIESEPERGTTVTVALAAASSEPAALEAPRAAGVSA